MSASYSKSDIKFWDSLELRKKLSEQEKEKRLKIIENESNDRQDQTKCRQSVDQD